MSDVPSNLIPLRLTGLPEYLGTSTLGYLPYVIEGNTYKVQFANIAAVGAVPSTRQINTGSGLGGGGDLSANRTLFILPGGVDDSMLTTSGVAAGTYGSAENVPVFTVNAQGRVTGVTDTPIVLSNYVPTSRTITAGAGLSGGGDLSANRTFAVNFSSTTPEPLGPGSPGVSTVAAREDHVHPAVDLSDTTETQGVLPLSRGGTGNSLSPVVGAIAYSSNNALYLTPTSGTAGQVLVSGGGVAPPDWQTITGAGTVTSVNLTAGTGISVSGGPITTSGSINVVNTAPDQVVSLTAGSNVTITGTYPSFTIAASGGGGGSGTVTSVNASGGTTGLSFTGGPITTSGTLTLGGTLAIANGGTGAVDAPTALTNLGAYPASNPSGFTSNTGTVTSVSGTGSVSGLSLSGTVTSTGSLTLGGTLVVTPSNFAAQTANTVLAAPDGAAGTPTFRAIVAADVPTLNQNTTGTASNVTGVVAVVNGGTGATTAPNARTNLSAAASGANTDITSIALTTGTITTAPTNGTDIVNKTYADTIASGINFHQSVDLATVAALPANTYNNGASGVGATLTANANGALSIDGVAVVAGDRVLIKNEVTQANNGVYVVTQTGSGAAVYILTRATDFDSAGSGVDQIDQGDFFLVTGGSTLANTSWVQQTPLPITVGTTAIYFIQFGAPITYSAGTGLSLAGTVFSITNTGVSAATYGSASSVPVIAVNAQGQATSVTDTSIAIAATQITSGVLPAANGGTGLSSPGTAGNVLTSTGTAWVSQLAPAGGITYTTVKTSNYTASNNDGVQTDTSGGAFTVTLPATPATGAQVFVIDTSSSWATTNLTVGRNGSTIEGSASDLICDISNVSVQLVYSGTTWNVFAQVGGASGVFGDVIGPASSTDNAITRFDATTGKLIQNSLVTVADDGAITAPQVGSMIPFYYANQAAFPSAATSHGAIAHSHADGAMFFAHGGAWYRLLDVNTTVAVANGGTGATTLTGIVKGTGTSALTAGTVSLTSEVTGTLPVANGGTGVTASTGTTAVVLSNSPTLVTPTLGAASATSVAAALGSVGAPSYTFTGNTNTGIYSPAADTIAFVEGGVEALRITSTGGITSADLVDAVGYKGLPQNSRTASYTLALSDMGKMVNTTTGGVVIPANASVAFPIGSAISIFNNSGSSQTISITTDTLRLAGTATTGSRTLAQYGLATCVKVAATTWAISGAGVT
jgi:hypothetical protein